MYEELQEVSHATLNYIDDLKAIDSNPNQPASERRKFAGIVFGDANYYLKNMLMILANNRHLALIHSIFKNLNICMTIIIIKVMLWLNLYIN